MSNAKGRLKVLYDFQGNGNDQLSIKANEIVSWIDGVLGGSWVLCSKGNINGWVPATYVELIKARAPSGSAPKPPIAPKASKLSEPNVDADVYIPEKLDKSVVLKSSIRITYVELMSSLKDEESDTLFKAGSQLQVVGTSQNLIALHIPNTERFVCVPQSAVGVPLLSPPPGSSPLTVDVVFRMIQKHNASSKEGANAQPSTTSQGSTRAVPSTQSSTQPPSLSSSSSSAQPSAPHPQLATRGLRMAPSIPNTRPTATSAASGPSSAIRAPALSPAGIRPANERPGEPPSLPSAPTLPTTMPSLNDQKSAPPTPRTRLSPPSDPIGHQSLPPTMSGPSMLTPARPGSKLPLPPTTPSRVMPIPTSIPSSASMRERNEGMSQSSSTAHPAAPSQSLPSMNVQSQSQSQQQQQQQQQQQHVKLPHAQPPPISQYQQQQQQQQASSSSSSSSITQPSSKQSLTQPIPGPTPSNARPNILSTRSGAVSGQKLAQRQLPPPPSLQMKGSAHSTTPHTTGYASRMVPPIQQSPSSSSLNAHESAVASPANDSVSAPSVNVMVTMPRTQSVGSSISSPSISSPSISSPSISSPSMSKLSPSIGDTVPSSARVSTSERVDDPKSSIADTTQPMMNQTTDSSSFTPPNLVLSTGQPTTQPSESHDVIVPCTRTKPALLDLIVNALAKVKEIKNLSTEPPVVGRYKLAHW